MIKLPRYPKTYEQVKIYTDHGKIGIGYWSGIKWVPYKWKITMPQESKPDHVIGWKSISKPR